MGGRGGFTKGFGLAALIAVAAPAAAQFSDSYQFMQAVKDRDGDKLMTYLNKPGQPTLNARDGASGDGALHILVRRHDTAWLGFLLARGAQVDIRDRSGNTPLMVAAQTSDPDAMRLLLLARAGVNIANASGETPLIVAVQRRDLVGIRALLAAGADPKIVDTIAGKSARDYAAEDNRGAAVVKLLDDAKPKPASAAISGPTLVR